MDRRIGETQSGWRTGRDRRAVYEIRIEGRLDPAWSDWLQGMAVSFVETETGASETVLYGPLPDQSGLRGILGKIWDLGAIILLVRRLPADGMKGESHHDG
ncbi:MAG: hypothetical protein JW929_06960 [Anaerolineales bacterium]|nr:hypothetical protein [Anaerolineales bacterium]